MSAVREKHRDSMTAAATDASPVSIDPFTRDDERRLEVLRLRKEHAGGAANMLPEEAEEYILLESKCEYFLEEGERRLRASAPGAVRSPASAGNGCTANMSRAPASADTADSPSWVDSVTNVVPTVTQAAATVARAAYFWSSLVGTAVPAVAKNLGLTSQFDHWNFITDRLILGALPVVTQVGSSGNHLNLLKQQVEQRGQTLGLVVACLAEEEMLGFGLQVVEFARKPHWEAAIGPQLEYVYLPMLDGTAGVTMENVRHAVDRLHDVLDVKKQCAYVHCKAGKGRSWMVCVCYLATYGGRSFENAEALVCMGRHQVNPSSSQREFARDFCKKFAADEEAKRMIADSVEPE